MLFNLNTYSGSTKHVKGKPVWLDCLRVMLLDTENNCFLFFSLIYFIILRSVDFLRPRISYNHILFFYLSIYLFHTHKHTPSLSQTHRHIHSHTLSHTLYLTHSITHTHTHTLYLSHTHKLSVLDNEFPQRRQTSFFYQPSYFFLSVSFIHTNTKHTGFIFFVSLNLFIFAFDLVKMHQT